MRFEKVKRWPGGIFAVGDAVCSFNPVYGQGMTSAAQQALTVRDLLDARLSARRGDVPAALADLVVRAPAAVATVVSVPWALATGPDRRLPGMPRKPLVERVIDVHVDRVIDAAATDRRVALAFMEVLNLLRPVSSLLTPGMLWRVGRRRPVRGAA